MARTSGACAMHGMYRYLCVPPRALRAEVAGAGPFWPVCIGHLLAADAILPAFAGNAAKNAVAALLSGPPSETVGPMLAGKLPKCVSSVTVPTGETGRAALEAYWRGAWEAPGRWKDAREAHGDARPAAREFASTPAARLLLRVARVPGIEAVMRGIGVETLPDLPVRSALALIIADDELQGAHYMSAETTARLEARA